MPDHPKMTNQKSVRSGEMTAITNASIKAHKAIIKVTTLDKLVRSFSQEMIGKSVELLS